MSATSKTNTKTKTHTKTNTKTKTKTKCPKDPSHAIFLKSWEFKDIRYDAYNDKDNDQKKVVMYRPTCSGEHYISNK